MWIAAGVVALLIAAAVLTITMRRSESRPPYIPSREERLRQRLLEELQPVALANCQLERFGERNDGGYLMCANLLDGVQAAYSYGISGYDGWGCDISRRTRVRVHQYDCFDLRQPGCPGGDVLFHGECVDGTRHVEEGRIFDTLQNQFGTNGDATNRLVVKMDVEGSEWETLLRTPNEILDRIDQLTIEFHGVDEPRFIVVVQKLKELFFVAHRHFNNFGCDSGRRPFPTYAYEVLFVSRRLGVLDPSGTVTLPHPLDAPNNPHTPDCQAVPQAH